MKFITIYIREIVIILIKIIHCTHHTKNTYSKITNSFQKHPISASGDKSYL